tara:strand:- start:4231 stop:4500 length:270 start_codon:yes stop_codon:yes gene_type:complete
MGDNNNNLELEAENFSEANDQDLINNANIISEGAKWVDNNNNEVKKVFGFNSNAELVNGRSAMVGFIMLIITELVLSGKPVTSSIFGLN